MILFYNRISYVFSLKKLHTIQLLIPSNSVFYQPNLERKLRVAINDESVYTNDNVIGTDTFSTNQFSIYYSWQTMESAENESLGAKNLRYFIEKANLDVMSSVQLIYGIFEQMAEVCPETSLKFNGIDTATLF